MTLPVSWNIYVLFFPKSWSQVVIETLGVGGLPESPSWKLRKPIKSSKLTDFHIWLNFVYQFVLVSTSILQTIDQLQIAWVYLYCELRQSLGHASVGTHVRKTNIKLNAYILFSPGGLKGWLRIKMLTLASISFFFAITTPDILTFHSSTGDLKENKNYNQVP
jgi:hypothetical protein